MKKNLRIAIQKKGRLSDKTKDLIKHCGIEFNSGNGMLKASAYNFPLEFLFLRDDDIPGYVANGVADIGIVGMNEVDEKGKDVKIIEKLGFSKCRLSIAVPSNTEYKNIASLNNSIIATSYPNILSKYLKQQGVNAKISEISGSVEISPNIGLSDAIFDIVSTGSTLLKNGLKEVEIIYESEAVLISNNDFDSKKNKILDKLLLRIKSVENAKNNKYILLNTPNESIKEISKILPGMKSPTILPLAIDGWSSLHSVVQEDDFWEVIEKLKKLGAKGILVIPIENMVF